MQLMDKTAFF